MCHRCPKVYSSTDPPRLQECLLRRPGTVPSALLQLGLSVASGERHVHINKLPFSQKRVPAVSGALISRAARLSHTHAIGLGAPGISRRGPVDPAFSLSLLVSVHETLAMPLKGRCLFLILAPTVDIRPWQEDLCFSVLSVQISEHTILTRPAKEVDLRVLHPFDVVDIGPIHKFSLYCGKCLVSWQRSCQRIV